MVIMKEHLGELYDKTSDFQQQQFDQLTHLVLSTVSNRPNITTLMDIGAGTGARTRQCLGLFPALRHVSALEPDWDMIEIAEKKYSDPRIKYVKMSGEDIGNLPADLPAFEMVLSNWAMHWIADKDRMMQALATRTTQDSWFAFSTCERLPSILSMIDTFVRNEFRLSQAKSPFHYLDRNGWTAFLARYGYEVLGLETRQIKRHVEDAEKYLEHWFTASTTRFLYGRHMVELSQESARDLLWMIKRAYPSDQYENGLGFEEEGLYIVARKKAV